MNEFEIRLEILKICYRHDRQPEEITAIAGKLENYVISSCQSGESVAANKRGPGRPPKTDKSQDPV